MVFPKYIVEIYYMIQNNVYNAIGSASCIFMLSIVSEVFRAPKTVTLQSVMAYKNVHNKRAYETINLHFDKVANTF